MQCPNCGNSMPEGSSFCTSCGTPLGDDTKTVLLDPNQTGANGPSAPENMQPSFNAQPMNGQPMGQTGYGQPMNGQPMNGQPMGQPYGQPMNGQPMGQPYGQPMNGQPYGQPYGQPMGQPGYGQPMNGQPGYGQPRPPKAPAKPLSPKAKKNILLGLIGVVALAVIIFVIVLLTRPKLKGSYKGKDSWGDTYTLVFDDGTFVWSDDDGDIYAAGTYTIKKDKIEMVAIDGDEYSAKFDNKENRVRVDGDWYKSKDKKKTLNFKLTKTYLDDLQKKVEAACASALRDENVKESLYWTWWSYITEDDLKNPSDDFEKFLAKELDYSNDEALSELMEGDYLYFDIEWTDIDDSDFNVTVDAW